MQHIANLSGLNFWLVEPGNRSGVREEFLRLRYDEYVVRKGWEPDQGTGREEDEKDPFSDYILGFQENELVCGCRLIHGSKTKLPVEEEGFFPEGIKPEGVEVSRLINKRTFLKVRDVRVDVMMLAISAKHYIHKGCPKTPTYVVMRQGFLRIISCDIWEKLGEPFEMNGKGKFVPALTNPTLFLDNLNPRIIPLSELVAA